MSSHVPNRLRVLRPHPAEAVRDAPRTGGGPRPAAPEAGFPAPGPPAGEPLWRHVVGGVLRRERLAQERTLKDVADEARISMPYLSEIERGLKEASSEVLAAAARALGLRLADLLTLAQDDLSRAAARRTVRTGGELIRGGRSGFLPPTAGAREPGSGRHRGEVLLAA
ncbi:helix-turn-helix domain-containing protein [Streptomyces sp. NPDC004609]|uniref:helix-turn-helix domain-containing protein n=1 Tax=Streptomyces sp. NPDC004609 TaxID=3364704 RepID=UPI0036CDDE67